MAITSANQLELLQTAEAVAREKMIDPELVVEAMEDSLARAAKSRYGAEMDIRVKIDRKTGRATFTRVRTVVEDDGVENYQAQATAEQAREVVARQRPAVTVVSEGAGRQFLLRNPTDADARRTTGVNQLADPEVGDELVDRVLAQLPSGYALLFGKAELVPMG